MASIDNVIYLQDRKPGIHRYYPELGDRKPQTKIEACLDYDGKHYRVSTPLELKGSGIIEEQNPAWIESCYKQKENWRSYRLTRKAFDRLAEQYPISMECLLD